MNKCSSNVKSSILKIYALFIFISFIYFKTINGHFSVLLSQILNEMFIFSKVKLKVCFKMKLCSPLFDIHWQDINCEANQLTGNLVKYALGGYVYSILMHV